MPKYIVDIEITDNTKKEDIVIDNVISSSDNREKEKLEIFQTLKEYAIFAYEQEVKREDAIKTQANNMQSAFAFVSAAVVMSMPVVFEFRGDLNYTYLYCMFSSILIFLGISLLFATLSLKFEKQEGCSEILKQKSYFEEHYSSFTQETARIDYWIQYYDEMHKTKRITIEKRIKLINWSRWMFIASLSLCLFWFIVSTIIYYIL